jgi:hypothetical protein
LIVGNPAKNVKSIDFDKDTKLHTDEGLLVELTAKHLAHKADCASDLLYRTLAETTREAYSVNTRDRKEWICYFGNTPAARLTGSG